MTNANLTHSPTGPAHRLALVCIVFVCPMLVLLFRGMNVDVLVRFFPDDAFYYLQIGANIWQHGLVSFDGINSTTGFHPLNQLLAALAVGCFGRTGAMVFYVLLDAVALAVSVWLIAEALRLSRKAMLVASALLLLPFFDYYLITSSGMESPLMLMCFAGYANVMLSIRDWASVQARQAIALGAWAGLLVLARLDMVLPLLCIAPLLVFHVCRRDMARGAQWLLLCGAVAAAVFVPYLLWMLHVQGNVMPVSSIAKYGRTAWAFSTVWYTMTGGKLIGSSLLLFYAIAPVIFIVVARRELSTVTGQFVIAIAASGLTYLAYVMFVAHEPFKWYLNYSAFTCFVLLIWYLSNVKGWFEALPVRFATMAVVGAVLIGAAFIGYWSKLETTSYGLYQTTLRMNQLVHAGQVIATNDAGTAGYFSTSTVHNLDGLVNSMQNYVEFLQRQDYSGYDKKYGVNYLLLRPDSTVRHQSDGTVVSQLPAGATLVESFDVPRFGELVLVKLP